MFLKSAMLIKNSLLLLLFCTIVVLESSPLKAVEPEYIANFPPGQRQNLPPRNSENSRENKGINGTEILLEEPTPESKPPTLQLTLRKAIAMIADTNPSINAANLDIKMAQREMSAASGARMPAISLQAMAKDTNVGDRWLEFGELGENIRDLNADSAAIAGVVVDVPIYLGGLLDSTERIAKRGEKLARLNKKIVIQQTIYNVISEYLDILVEQNAVKLEDSRYEQKIHEIDTAKEKANERFALKQQVLALELEANEIRRDKLTHQNNLRISRNKLLNELGISPDMTIEVDPRVGISEIIGSEKDAIKEAFKNNLNLQMLMEKIGIAREKINIEASKEKTNISFNWAYFHTYSLDNPDTQYDEWEAKLQGKINIFDGGRTRNNRFKEIENVKKEEVQLKDASQKVELSVREAFSRYSEASKLLKNLDDNIALAREMLRFVDERVSARVLLKDALLKSQVDLLEAQQSKFAVHATLLKARAAIYLLTGELTVDKVG
jgi:outer membrane protein TolC